jgi:NAD(P)-dependent dehydrogenase (short-subunit alcohol dehydrogenase family)
MTQNMNGKKVLITGPAGNLGLAVAKKFQAAGSHLILPDRDPERLLELYPDLVDDSHHQLITNLDLLDLPALEEKLGHAIDKNGGIDILVHTVGGFEMGEKVYEISAQSWEKMIDLNVKTLLNITRVVLPPMIRQGSGKIITVGARPAFSGKGKMGAYSAAKAAVLRLTESLSREVRSKGINANCLIPGTIDTPENRQAMPEADFSSWVAPDSLADVILFLSSPAADDIHGAAVPAYGA